MWGPLARGLDRFVAWGAGRQMRFFGKTDPSDYRLSFHDMLRRRLHLEPRLLTPVQEMLNHQPAHTHRRSLPTAIGRIAVDRGGTVVESGFDYYARGHRGRTLIVYHHGLGEIPHDLSFRWILLRDSGPNLPADLICCQATGHRSYRQVNETLAHLSGFATLVGDGMMTMRAIARAFRHHYNRVVCLGASLGGLVTIAEAALSASYDLNISLIAHLDLVEVMRDTVFRRLIDSEFRACCPWEIVRPGIDAERLVREAQRRLVMINGTHDMYFRVERARELWAQFKDIDHYELPHGHISMGMAPRLIKRTLIDILSNRRTVA